MLVFVGAKRWVCCRCNIMEDHSRDEQYRYQLQHFGKVMAHAVLLVPSNQWSTAIPEVPGAVKAQRSDESKNLVQLAGQLGFLLKLPLMGDLRTESAPVLSHTRIRAHNAHCGLMLA